MLFIICVIILIIIAVMFYRKRSAVIAAMPLSVHQLTHATQSHGMQLQGMQTQAESLQTTPVNESSILKLSQAESQTKSQVVPAAVLSRLKSTPFPLTKRMPSRGRDLTVIPIDKVVPIRKAKTNKKVTWGPNAQFRRLDKMENPTDSLVPIRGL